MSKYTTGEIAKLCEVTVRTVQYYDQRGLLIPSELSEGGRRLYSDQDLIKMASARYFKKNDTIEVGRLMVAPSFRNQGLAFSIMKNVEDHSRGSKFELFTCTRSWINIRLYEKLGYRIFKEGIDDNELPLAYMEKCINENT